MAQVAALAVRRVSVPRPSMIWFQRAGGPRSTGRQTTIRLAALVRGPGRVEVGLRCATTAFQLDHFRATCRFDAVSGRRLGESAAGSFQVPGSIADVPLDPRAWISRTDPLP